MMIKLEIEMIERDRDIGKEWVSRRLLSFTAMENYGPLSIPRPRVH